MVCDVSFDEIPTGGGVLVTASVMRFLATNGFRPPANIGPIEISFDEWLAQVRSDETDWLLCDVCAQRARRYGLTFTLSPNEVAKSNMSANTDLYTKADDARNQGDYAAARTMFTQIANANEDGEETTWAMIRLAQMEKLGEGGQNLEAAEEWIKKAIDHGGMAALFNIGYMIFTGKGFSEDQAVGIKLIAEAATRDNPDAMLQLGLVFEQHGDLETATKWYNALSAKSPYWAEQVRATRQLLAKS